jgi:ketosteroid isomerase-like protein
MKYARTFLWLAVIVLAPAAFAGSPGKAEQELLAVEDAWTAALIKSDIPALEKLYATEYLFTDPSGAALTREQDMASTKSGEFVVKAVKLEDVKVHVYGTFATVTGINNLTASDKGTDVSGAYRFTDVFVKRDGRWQCVATQATRVTKTP